MVPKIYQVVLVQFLLLKVASSYGPPYSKKHYVQREPRPPGPNPRQIAYSSQGYLPSSSYPNYQGAAEYAVPPYQRPPEYGPPYERYEVLPASYPRPTEFLPPVHQIPNEVLVIPEAQMIPNANLPVVPSALEVVNSNGSPKTDLESPKKCSKTLDPNVLNNLAIALQLLIVSNIINSPKSDPGEIEAYFDKSLLDLGSKGVNPLNLHSNLQLPSSKFLCSSNFGDDISKTMLGLGSVGSGVPLPRPGLNLMSPYDSIALNSPFADSVPVSPYMGTKNEFQSPYAAMLAADRDKNLFSMADFF